jgi:hypothetical protein
LTFQAIPATFAPMQRLVPFSCASRAAQPAAAALYYAYGIARAGPD